LVFSSYQKHNSANSQNGKNFRDGEHSRELDQPRERDKKPVMRVGELEKKSRNKIVLVWRKEKDSKVWLKNQRYKQELQLA